MKKKRCKRKIEWKRKGKGKMYRKKRCKRKGKRERKRQNNRQVEKCFLEVILMKSHLKIAYIIIMHILINKILWARHNK